MACPICGKSSDVKFRPFCSKRCADIDLGKWISGSYAIPSENPDDLDALEQELNAAETDKPH